MQPQEMSKDLREIFAAGERELQQAIAFMNDEAVPAIRAEGLRARLQAARLLRQWADRLDAGQGKRSPGVPG